MMEMLKDHTSHTLEAGTPAIICFKQNMGPDEFSTWYRENQMQVLDLINEHGAVMFREISVDSVEKFAALLEVVNEGYIDYIDGNSPRTKINGSIYTSTEYDPNFRITQHNELSYSANWPAYLYMCCVKPSETGGETPLADGREVLKKMPPALVDKIRKEKIRYTRNLHGGAGLGPSWQDTFETSDKAKAEAICQTNNTEYTWLPDGGLRVCSLREGIISTKSGEAAWFNQIDQFHPSHLEPEIYETLLQMAGNNPEALPMYVCYGNGDAFSDQDVAEIQKNIEAGIKLIPWHKGDFMIIDNELVSHGRMPFEGERRILVAMK